MLIPPGISYLFRNLPAAILPSVVTYLIFSKLTQFQAGWIPILAAFLVQPLVFVLGLLYTSLVRWKGAARLGAVQIPQVPDWPGGLTNLGLLGKMLESGYPGEHPFCPYSWLPDLIKFSVYFL
jgi:hypothetical protein